MLATSADELGLDVDAELVLKLEQLQVTGSFKPRGAFNLLLSRDDDGRGVVAASGGNFGLAVAHAATTLGVQAAIFVPATSPAEKIDRLRNLGADVHVIDGFYDAALAASREHATATDAFQAHAYDQFEVVAGQGTCGAEFEDQTGQLDTVLVAVGGGGLIGGVASWFEPTGTRVIGIETEGCPTLHAAHRAGEPVQVEVGGLCASSLGARQIGDICWAVSEQGAIADSFLVSDDDVRIAQQRLWDRCRLVAEPGGAAALAALTSGTYVPAPGERVGVIVCGANTDPAAVVV